MTSKSNLNLLALVLLGSAGVALSNDAIHVDTLSDLQSQPDFSVSCSQGYYDHPSDFICQTVGGIDVPSEELNGQVGFWTQCGDVGRHCLVYYYVQPGDTSFAARFYLRNLPVLIWISRQADIIQGSGWVDFNVPISNGTRIITMAMDHRDPNIFALLDRVAVNAELPPLVPEPPTNSTGRIM